MCVHTFHQPYRYPPLTLRSWQQADENPWCNSWHLCCHYARCWLPCGTSRITCVSFNHIQLLSSMNWHCAYQRWHSHLNQCCHYWPNTSKFTSPILHNSNIYHFWCSSSQRKGLLQPTPHWLILPFSNWIIWLLTQTCQCVFILLCQCHSELKRAKGPHLSTLVIFLVKKL